MILQFAPKSKPSSENASITPEMGCAKSAKKGLFEL